MLISLAVIIPVAALVAASFVFLKIAEAKCPHLKAAKKNAHRRQPTGKGEA